MLCEKNGQKSKYVKNLMNDQNIMFRLSPPMEKVEKSKKQNK